MLVKWAVLPGELLLPKWLDLIVVMAAAVSRQRSPGGRSSKAPSSLPQALPHAGSTQLPYLSLSCAVSQRSPGELSPGISGSNLIINSPVLTFLPSLFHFPTLSPCPL